MTATTDGGPSMMSDRVAKLYFAQAKTKVGKRRIWRLPKRLLMVRHMEVWAKSKRRYTRRKKDECASFKMTDRCGRHVLTHHEQIRQVLGQGHENENWQKSAQGYYCRRHSERSSGGVSVYGLKPGTPRRVRSRVFRVGVKKTKTHLSVQGARGEERE